MLFGKLCGGSGGGGVWVVCGERVGGVVGVKCYMVVGVGK